MNTLENTCIFCLSTGRSLVPVSKLNTIIQEIRLWELKQPQGNLCWECNSIIKKFYKFKIQCKHVQILLNENLQSCNLKSFSTLVSATNNSYDETIVQTFDPLTDGDVEIKTERDLIKEETEENVDDSIRDNEKYEVVYECVEIEHNSDSDCKDKIDIFDEWIESNEEKGNIKQIKQKTVKITDKGFKEKFEEIVFTEAEMLRNREEKRNQPNFKNIPFKCDKCVLGFMRKQNYEFHVTKKHNESVGRHSCPVCEVRFTNEKAVERHKRKHYVWYRCRLCSYDTRELWSAYNHCRLKHHRDTTDRIHCKQCTTVAKTPDEMVEHVRTEHSLVCNECGKTFKGKRSLRTHKIRIHAVKRDFLCDLCKMAFKTKTRLESHMVGHNTATAQRLAYCALCNVQYKNIYVYRNHLRNNANHSERTYSCPECKKKFVSKDYWTQHFNFYHLHKSKFNCEICNKLFMSNWRLKNHRQKHHGLSRSRDHPCNVCGKKFYTSSTLRAHKLTHSEQRSYMCEDCGDTFKQSAALYTHSRLVHKNVKKRK